MTPLQIIDETVSYYDKDVARRSIVHKRDGQLIPMIKTPAGLVCALGRCMTLAGLKTFGRTQGAADVVFERAEEEFNVDPQLGSPQWFLRDEYRGWDKHFWFELQKLHDVPGNWYSGGISSKGLAYANYLRNKYQNHSEFRVGQVVYGVAI